MPAPRLEHPRHLPLLCQEHRSHLRGPCALKWHEPALAVAVSFCLHPTVRASGTSGEPWGASAVCGSSASSAAATLRAVSAPCSACVCVCSQPGGACEQENNLMLCIREDVETETR